MDYDSRYLSVIPEEILERDYGCGNPSKHLHPGETVLDLGNGGGKICYIASQVVGPKGRVIGVEINDDMLALARNYRQSIGDALGYHNVELRKGKIQDLALDQERLEAHLESHPVRTVEELEAVGHWKEKERGVEIFARDERPWQSVESIEFRALTVRAFKGKEGPCLERHQAVIYKGPWRSVTDDDGHTLFRGQRMAVCDKTFNIYKSEPYAADIEAVEPYEEIPLSEAAPFDCRKDAVRHARETKGLDYDATETTDAPYCGPDGNCC